VNFSLSLPNYPLARFHGKPVIGWEGFHLLRPALISNFGIFYWLQSQSSFSVNYADGQCFNVFSYKEASYSCITESALPMGCLDNVIDSRYFYRTEGIGRATSLIAKKALANYLRPLCTHTEFLSTQWYRSIQMAGNNRSVLGFLIEQMLLSWVSGNGCPSAGQEENRDDRADTDYT
jgi:hypothetical protein